MIKNKDLQILIKAAHAGGKVLRKYFGQALSVVEKSTIADIRTKADLESERSILTILKKEFPKYNIQSEERGKVDNKSDYTLVVDPLDGTHNFVLGIPHFSISIALFYKGQPFVGVVYRPITHQTYSAVKNKGAYLNGKKIKVNKVADTKKLNIAYTMSYETYSKERHYVSSLIGFFLEADCKRIMDNWSAVIEYCMLASGKIESVITDGIELHDFAAGKLIAMESGAKIIDFFGKEEIDYTNSCFIASNTDEVNKYILTAVKPLQKLRKI